MTELLATCWTSAGDVRPGRTRDTSPVLFGERVRSAAAAGFTGMGFELADLDVVRDSIGYAAAARLLSESGVAHVEVEFLNDWWLDGGRRGVSDDRRRRLLEAAAELGAHHVKLGSGSLGDPRAREVLVEALGDLAREASRSGTRLAIETGAGSALDLAADVLPAVRLVSDPVVGVMLDPWHFVRSGTSYRLIDDISPTEIIAVELSDGAARPIGSLFDDTFDRRLLPGAGEFAVGEFVEAVARTGWRGVWGVEVMSDHLRGQAVPIVLQEAFDSAQRVLEPILDHSAS